MMSLAPEYVECIECLVTLTGEKEKVPYVNYFNDETHVVQSVA